MANTVRKALRSYSHYFNQLVSSQNHRIFNNVSVNKQHHINSSCHVPLCSTSIRSTELGRKLFLCDRVHYSISFSSPTIFPLAHQFSFSLALTHLYGDPSYQNIADIPFCPDFASEVSGTRSAENRCSPALSQAASMIMI